MNYDQYEFAELKMGKVPSLTQQSSQILQGVVHYVVRYQKTGFVDMSGLFLQKGSHYNFMPAQCYVCLFVCLFVFTRPQGRATVYFLTPTPRLHS
jgi:hypothetical protein